MRLHLSRYFLIKLAIISGSLFIMYLAVLNKNTIGDIAAPFIISILASYLLNPVVSAMEKRGIRRVYGILMIYVLLALLLLLLGFYIIPRIISEAGKLIDILPQYNIRFGKIIQSLQDMFTNSGLPDGIKNTIEGNIGRFQSSVTLYLESIISFIADFISEILNYALVPILLYYFLKDYDKIGKRLMLLTPRKYRKQGARICSEIDEIFGSYIRCQLILSAIITVLTTAALVLIGIDFALIIGIINGITNIIPYFGPIIGTVPAVLLALLQSPAKALYTLGAMIIIQQFESGIISPKITGECVDLHPVTVIFALLVGEEFFGVTGMILGVPIAAAIKIICNDIVKNLF